MTSTAPIRDQLAFLSNNYGLGKVTNVTKLAGGRLHRCWRLTASNGEYVVKKLHWHLRHFAQICTGEQIGSVYAQVLTTITAYPNCHGQLISTATASGDRFMVYRYLDARTLSANLITPSHASFMGQTLATMHQSRPSLPTKPARWNYCLALRYWQPNWPANITQLSQAQSALIDQIESEYWHHRSTLANNLVVTHGDLDPNNVLWSGSKPIIIDWERAGLVNQTQDLVASAIYWSLDEQGVVRQQLLQAFIQAYKQHGASIAASELPAAFVGLLAHWLNWLWFNLAVLADTATSSSEQQQRRLYLKQTLQGLHLLVQQREVIIGALQEVVSS